MRKKALNRNPNIKRMVGHSSGGSVALELQKQYYYILQPRSYGAPVLYMKGVIPNYNNQYVERYRNYSDIVSVFVVSSFNIV